MTRIRLALLGLLLLAAPARTQTLTMAVEAPFGLDPHFLFAGPNMAAARQVYDSLINRDAESRFVPGIVERWEATGPQEWTLHLRRGVTFHDGGAFTADDVAFSIARVPSLPNNPGPYTSNLRTIARVEVVDPHTIRLHTDQPNPVLPGQLTNIFVVSKRVAEAATDRRLQRRPRGDRHRPLPRRAGTRHRGHERAAQRDLLGRGAGLPAREHPRHRQ